MTEPEFLTLAEVLAIHDAQLERFGGAPGVRDLGLLESAISMPQAGFGGAFLHQSLHEMAAAYAYHISENQPFIDGNKRTALAACLVFLELNDCTVDDPKGLLFDAMIKIGTRRMTKAGMSLLLLKKLSAG